jgi:predicted small integral membrane protein
VNQILSCIKTTSSQRLVPVKHLMDASFLLTPRQELWSHLDLSPASRGVGIFSFTVRRGERRFLSLLRHVSGLAAFSSNHEVVLANQTWLSAA